MTLEGLGELFKGDSADMCAGKFPLVLMGGRADRQACEDGERGPPSARAEIFEYISFHFGYINLTVPLLKDAFFNCLALPRLKPNTKLTSNVA
jgi:hypothetical protein